MSQCQKCRSQFEVSPEEQDFLNNFAPQFNGQKYYLSDPSKCKRCRRQHRLTWRAERHLYQRQCDLTGKTMISIFSPDSPYKVYSTDAWFSDKWDPLDYGQDYDPKRPFFDQYREVQLNTPRLGLIILDNQNSPYVSQCWHLKNCYLCVDAGYCEDSYYCYSIYHSSNSVDVTRGEKLELCYECIACSNCYQGIFLQDCHNCHESYFSYDCQGCKKILFCSNLRNQEYMIANQKVSPEEFERRLKELKLTSHINVQKAKEKFLEVKSQAIHKAHHNINCENCSGDYLEECKNCHNCFEGFQAEDCLNVTRIDHKAKDVMDCDHVSELELGYNGVSMAGYHNMCCYNAVYSDHLYYCDIVFNSKNCFGCSSLNKKEYCILNKQYTKEEYDLIVPKIIAQMTDAGEWGSFFPEKYSLFSYNETLAQELWPLTKEEAIQEEYLWSDYEKPAPEGIKTIESINLPDNIVDIPDDVLNWALICEGSGKPFKIINQELDFYRRLGLPIPHRHPDQRHLDRQALRNPRRLFVRNCHNCEKSIQTSYEQSRPEKVLCEDCYLSIVY